MHANDLGSFTLRNQRRLGCLSCCRRPNGDLQQPQPAHQPIGPSADLRRRWQPHLGRPAQLHLGRREPAGRHHLSQPAGQADDVHLRRARPAHDHRQHASGRRQPRDDIVPLVRVGHLPGAQRWQHRDPQLLRRGRVRAGHAGAARSARCGGCSPAPRARRPIATIRTARHYGALRRSLTLSMPACFIIPIAASISHGGAPMIQSPGAGFRETQSAS